MGPKGVLLADVIGSSTLSNEGRLRLDDTLREAFSKFNQQFEPLLSADLDTTVGDEFEAVFDSPGETLVPLQIIRCWLASQAGPTPTMIRSAIGIGTVSVAGARTPRRQDGPAFHVARRLMERLKAEKRLFGIECSGGGSIIQIANLGFDAGCRLIDSIQDRWTLPQWEAAYWRWQGEKSVETARLIGVAPQNITKRLQSAHFNVINHAINAFKTILSNDELLQAIEMEAR
jgi:hypothetical protein